MSFCSTVQAVGNLCIPWAWLVSRRKRPAATRPRQLQSRPPL